MKKHTHANIPIFIPHLGCPNDCVFCNQRTISGRIDFDRTHVRSEIEAALNTIGERCAEIAFFGGSFTGIDREFMAELLDMAQEYVELGKVSGIRLSTRPDYINDEILDILSNYTVNAVELGIQSTSNKVLSSSRRGHTREQSEKAMHALSEHGFRAVGQMMIGLPGADAESELKTAEDICRWGATAARVYPTVVFRGTELCAMTETGKYLPLDTKTAVTRTASVLDVFDRYGVDVIRVGLCSSDNLSSDKEVYGGANHPAIGELAMNELYFRRICDALDKIPISAFRESLTIAVGIGQSSKAIGQKKCNILRLKEKYGINIVKVIEKEDILRYNIIIV